MEVNPNRLSDGGARSTSKEASHSVRESQRAVVDLLGRLGALMTGIEMETREQYQHALVLSEFAETMYLSYSEDLGENVDEMRSDRLEDYGAYMKSHLLADNGLRDSIQFLAADNTEALALLDKLERQPGSFGIEDGLELVNRLLGTDLSPEYYRNAASNGFRIAFDEMGSIFGDRKTEMAAAIRDARQPLQILQEIIQGQQESLR